MNIDIIINAWKVGYRTKTVCCALATLLYKHYFYRREFNANSPEDTMKIAYGSPDTVYGEYTAMEIMDRGAFYSYYDEKENSETYEKMEAAWESLHERRYNKRFQRHYKVESENNYNNDERKIFMFEYPSEDGCWCSRERASRAAVIIDGTKMTMTKVRGVDPTLEQTAVMCLAAASHSAAIHKYNRGERVHPYKINSRIGYSGCKDFWLDIYKRGENNIFIKWFNAAKLHVSMAGKVSDITDMYVGDALELLTVAMGYRDFDYFHGRISKRYGVHFVRPYKNEVLAEADMDFVPKKEGHRRPSRRR